MEVHILVIFAAIGLLAIFCQWLAWWVKLPAILPLLLAGLILGPLAGWLNPPHVFGHLLYPIISLSVAVILFEGSLTLKFEDWRAQRGTIHNLISLGVVITAVATSILAHFIFKLPWQISALLGAITAVTGPTVIAPMLRTVRPSPAVANILRWEAIMIDPIGVLLALLVYAFITSYSADATMKIFSDFVSMISIGTIGGLIFGYAFGIVLRRYWLPKFLHNVATLTFVITLFTITYSYNDGAGLLAVTVMGLTLTNMKKIPVEDILGFKESLSVLLISGLFIILAANVQWPQLQKIIGASFLFFLVLQFIVRPLSILLCTFKSNLTWGERGLLAWVAPRGIVAAAVSAIFSVRLQNSGIVGIQFLVPITFAIIIFTVVFQSFTARFVALWLKVAEPEPKGFLIVGANAISLLIGEALMANGFRVLVAGMNRDNINAARMAGLPVYYGNAISEHADRHLDLVGIGRVLALSPQSDLNTLVSLRYRREFSRKVVYTIRTEAEQAGKKHTAADRYKGHFLFGYDTTFAKLASMIAKGATIHSTPLTENFDFDAYQQEYGSHAIPLFAIDPKDRLRVFTTENEPHLDAGWTLISLIQEEAPKN